MARPSRNRVGTAYSADGLHGDRPRARGRGARRIEGLPRGRRQPAGRASSSSTRRASRSSTSSSTRARRRSRDRAAVELPRVHGELRRRARRRSSTRSASASPAEAEAWWGHCVGYPGHRPTAPRSGAGSRTTRSTPTCSPRPTRPRACRTCARASRCASGSSSSPPTRRASTRRSSSERFLSDLRGRALMERRRQPVLDLQFRRPPNLPAPPRRAGRHRSRRHPGQRPARLHLPDGRLHLPAHRRRRPGAGAARPRRCRRSRPPSPGTTARRPTAIQRRLHLRAASRRSASRTRSSRSFPDEFREGMAARAELLGDRGPSAPEHWEPGLGTGEAHVLVTV